MSRLWPVRVPLQRECKKCQRAFSTKKRHKLYCSIKCAKAVAAGQIRDWYQRNRTEARKSRRDYYRKNKPACKARSARWYKNNRNRRIKIRRRWELKQYGLTPEQFQQMHKIQKGCCWICSRKMTPPVVDHCHHSGKVRGLLCRSCNWSLGHIQDNSKWLRKAIQYLERRGPQQ